MPSPPSDRHHMLRVRISKRIFARLQAIAKEETDEAHENVSVSDLVRSALIDWIVTHEASHTLSEDDMQEQLRQIR